MNRALGHAYRKTGKLSTAFKDDEKAQRIALDSLCCLPCEQYRDLKEQMGLDKSAHPPVATRCGPTRPYSPPPSPQGNALNGTHFTEPWVPRALAVLRIVVGYLFLQHGSAKLLGFPHVAMFDNLSVMSMIGLAGILELVGGTLILVGLFVRPVAFVLSGEMAVAYFVGHAPRGNFLFPTLNQGEGAVLYCFVFLFLAVAGAGVWSIDAARRVRSV